MEDIILKPDLNRFVMFPIKNNVIWEMYKKHVDLFWRPEEIDLTVDINDWKKLDNNEQRFISIILAFFAASDGIVSENLGIRFLNEVQLAEARAFYSFQLAMENIHSHTYSLLIDTFIKDEDSKKNLFQSLKTYKTISQKGEWGLKWINDTNSNFATRLVAYACIEGIFFSGSFCSIFWLKSRGLMPGLTFSNELISRDEALHTEFAILLYSILVEKISNEKIISIIMEAVEIEIEFICEAVDCRLIGINIESMSDYIRFCADRLAVQFGCNKIYNVKNPFQFMELISLECKTNFFEKRNGAYSLANKSKNDIFITDEINF